MFLKQNIFYFNQTLIFKSHKKQNSPNFCIPEIVKAEFRFSK